MPPPPPSPGRGPSVLGQEIAAELFFRFWKGWEQAGCHGGDSPCLPERDKGDGRIFFLGGGGGN